MEKQIINRYTNKSDSSISDKNPEEYRLIYCQGQYSSRGSYEVKQVPAESWLTGSTNNPVQRAVVLRAHAILEQDFLSLDTRPSPLLKLMKPCGRSYIYSWLVSLFSFQISMQ